MAVCRDLVSHSGNHCNCALMGVCPNGGVPSYFSVPLIHTASFLEEICILRGI